MYPMTTHVICGKCSESEYSEFKKYQDVFVVGLDFVMESLKFKKKVLEEDYEIKPTKNSRSRTDNTSFVTYNSQNKGFESFKFINSSNFRIEGKDFTLKSNTRRKIRPFDSNNENSMDFFASGKLDLKRSQSMKPKVTKSLQTEIKFKSLLFKNYYFYFLPTDTGLRDFKRMVIENSGSIVTNLEKVKTPENKKIYIVLKDGQDKNEFKKLREKIMPISPRFIDYCIKKKTVIKDPVEEKLMHLLPFPVKTPCSPFKNIILEIRGFDWLKSTYLIETSKVLGFIVKEEKDEEEAHVVICDAKVYKKLTPEEKKKGLPVYKKENWLLRCLTKGKFSDNFRKVFLNLLAEKETNESKMMIEE